MAAERTLRLKIVESRRGRALKDVEDDLDRVNRKAKESGEKGGRDYGDGFSKGLSGKLTDISRAFSGKFTKSLTSATDLSAKSVATAFSAQFIATAAAGIASGVGKLAHGLGAVGALLPAAAFAGVTAFAALKLAISGVGDALEAGLAGDTEKFEEALAGLAPAAQAVAREVVGLKGEFDGLRSTVQENFFAPLVGQVQGLAQTWMPVLRSELGLVAGGFGQMIRQIAGLLQVPANVNRLSGALTNSRVAVTNLTGGVVSLVAAFIPLISVGSSFLPQLTAGADRLTARFHAFMVEAEQTGRLREFIQGGLDKLRELWETTRQVGRIIGNLAEIGRAAMEGLASMFDGLGVSTGGILDTFERLTERAAAFVNTAAGSETLSTIFDTLGSVLSGAFGWLQRLGQLVGRVFGPIAPQIAELFESFANLKTSLIDALEPALVSIGGVIGRNVLPAITGLFDTLARNRPVLQGIGIAIATLLLPSTIAWAAATIAAMAPWILLGAAIAAVAAIIIIHFDTIKSVVGAVFNWIRDNWQLLLIILTGPIGAAVVLIVQHWDTIKNAILAVWNWITENWQLLLGIITGPIGAAVAILVTHWDSIKNAVTAVKDWITSKFDEAVSFISGLPGRIGEALAGIWDGLTGGLVDTLNWIIDRLNSALDAIDRAAGPFVNFPSIPNIGGGPPPGRGGGGGGPVRRLAEGGIVQATPGGVLAILAEAGHDEAVIPLDGQHSIGGPSEVRVVFEPGGDRLFKEWIRHMIRAEYGGDVQRGLGQN